MNTRKIKAEEMMRKTKFANHLYSLDGNIFYVGFVDKLMDGLALSVSCSDVIIAGEGRSRAIIISSDDVKELVNDFGELFIIRMMAFVIAHETGHIDYWNNFPVIHKGELVMDVGLEADADIYAIEHARLSKKAYQSYINVFDCLMRSHNKKNLKIPLRWFYNHYNTKLGMERMKKVLSSANFVGEHNPDTINNEYYKLAKQVVESIIGGKYE